MTLFRQIILAVLALFIVFYAGNTFVNISNSHMLVEKQMQVHAEDTATSLALSMTQAVQQQDYAMLETLFNAVSDSGFFQRIYFRNMQGEIEIDNRFPVVVEGVPPWFIERVALPEFQGTAEVVSGWTRMGEVVVISHPGQAYLQLWLSTRSQLIWSAAMVLIACLLTYLALRWILAPLAKVESQADAIAGGDFPVQESLPGSRELRRVVEAMNRMSGKLKKSFSDQLELIVRLREQSATDEVTGLSNRADFDARVAAYVGDETGSHNGLLAIVAVEGLPELNLLAGRQEGNAFLREIAATINRHLAEHPHAIVARRQGVEFTIFVPDIPKAEASELAIQLFDVLKSLRWGQSGNLAPTFNMGFVFEEAITSIPHLLSCADMALTKARQTASNSCQNFAAMNYSDAPVLSSPYQLQEVLENAINKGSIVLHFQPVFTVAEQQLLSHEVYVRFPSDGNLLGAAALVPMAEKLGYVSALDKLVLQKAASVFTEKGLAHPLRINLSVNTVQSEGFCDWLETFLLSNEKFAPYLMVEIRETSLRNNCGAVALLNSVLNKYQAALCIDNFGLEASSFAYLANLNVQSLKVHRSFSRDLENQTDNQFYIRTLAELAHSLDLQLYVEGVESQLVYEKLPELNVDGCQGYFLGEPKEEPVVQI